MPTENKTSHSDSAHTSKWVIAEVIFGIPLIVGIALHFLFPLSLSQGVFKLILLLAGILLLVAGICIIILARREFTQFHQPTDPGKPTSKIITTGVFSLSRNPLYLGTTVVLLGITALTNMLWILIALLAGVVICHYLLIVPEEKYLLAKFGDEYRDYMSSVSRWFGRKRNTNH